MHITLLSALSVYVDPESENVLILTESAAGGLNEFVPLTLDIPVTAYPSAEAKSVVKFIVDHNYINLHLVL